MSTYVLRRFVSMIPVLLIVSIISFGLLYVLPGDPAAALLGDDAIGGDLYQAMRRDLGLDQPIWVQYAKWLANVVQGDLGTSIRTSEPVLTILLNRMPASLWVGSLGLLIGLIIGLTVAVISALNPGSKLDTFASVIALGGVALPSFWQALLLVYIFAVQLKWALPSGFTSPLDDPKVSLQMLILPAIVLGTHSSAVIMRQGRSALLEVLGQDYIQTARAKGLRERGVIIRHALKNALLPVVTIIGLQVGNLVSGAAIVETVFAIPGIGRAAVDAISTRDYPVLQGAVLMLTVSVMIANLLTDIAYGYLDPRIRYQ